MSVSIVFLYYACCELAYRISDALLNDVDAGVVGNMQAVITADIKDSKGTQSDFTG